MFNNKSYFEEIQEKYKMESIIYNPMNFCEDGLYIFFSSKRTYHCCNNCNCIHTIVHDYTDKTIKGGTMNGVPIYLNLRHCRYLCKECNSTFMEQFDYLPPYKVMTIEAENYIISKLGSLSFFELSCDIGVSIQTIVNRAKDFGAQERIEKLAGHYRYLSMDEVFISRNEKGEAQYYWLLNDNSIRWKSNNIRIDIGRNKDDVIKRLKELKNADDVIGVSIDMWKPYRDAISEVFPNALIVIDPFHVIKTAESAMNSVRKGLECPNLIKLSLKKDAKLFLSSIYKLTNDELDRLESYLKLDPKLEKSYFIVQELLEFYWIKDHEDALEYIAEWEKEVFCSGVKEMENVLSTVQNWLPYIMNYFIHRITNGKTEGKNNLLRVIDRIGFHYGLVSIQACIYAHDRKQEIIKWRKYQKRQFKKINLVA